MAGQIGLEPTPEAFVASMVAVFREVRRVLRDDGVCWLNLGDSYAANRSYQVTPTKWASLDFGKSNAAKCPDGLKPKDLIGIPWRVAFALQADGWYLRSDIIWCLSGGTWLYAKTRKGEMPVMVKDLVRLDPSTVQLWNGQKWTQVLGWNRSASTDDKLELVLRSGERIGCTAGHQWPTQRGNVRAADLKPGDVIRTCMLPESPHGSRPQYLTDDALWLVGLYLAEGSMSGDTIQIAAHADESKWLSRIEAVARHYGGSMTHTLDGNKLSIRLYGRVLRAILETYVGGKTAADKHLKVAAWSLPFFGLREIARGYLDGDGHADPSNNRIRLGFCRNYAMERDLRTLAARLGATLTLKPVVAQSQWGKFPAFRGEWRWEKSGHHNEKDRGEVVAIRKSRARHCWDIGVADEPHLFALASGVLTHNSKPNPMPESVTDRPTKAHEYVFLLTKRDRYFYDNDAARQPLAPASEGRYAYDFGGAKNIALAEADKDGIGRRTSTIGRREPTPGANLRTVWSIPTQPYGGAHFATFPEEMPRRCIKVGTSEAGCCAACRAPWVREVESERVPTRPGVVSKVYIEAPVHPDSPVRRHAGDVCGNRDPRRHVSVRATRGWRQDCGCPSADPVPCLVFDPFNGSGTTGAVARQLDRRYVGFDLSRDYLGLAVDRIGSALTPKSKLDAGPALKPTAGQLPLFEGVA